MALVVKDRVKETTVTVGTIALVLAGAASGFQSFSAIGNGNTTYYAIDGGAEWEVGIGTYTSVGTALSRDTILASSNGGSAVNFSAGTKSVFVTYPAGKGIYTDASGNAIALGTPASATLTNATGLPISTGVSGLGTGVATFLATPTAANLASAVTDETGSGSLVFATLPTFDTTGIKFSGSTSGTTTVLSGAVAGTSVLTLPVATDTLVGKATTDTLTNKTLTSPSLTTPVLGTPSSGTLTSCTGLPLTTGVTGVLPVANGGTNASTASITSFNNITGYTAAGATGTTSTNLVFSTSPTLVTPTLGVASATSVNKVAITSPATSSTLTIADGSSLATSGAFSTTLTATATTNVTLPTTGTLSTLAGTETFTNKTFTGYTETVYAVIDAAGVALSPTNGTIQTWTLGASRTPTAGTWAAGQSMTLMINDGTAYTITWTTLAVTWVGGSAPTLATTGFTVIVLWKVGSTIYGSYIGAVA